MSDDDLRIRLSDAIEDVWETGVGTGESILALTVETVLAVLEETK